jgi:chemotaxis protein MotB
MASGGGSSSWKVAYADFVTAMMALFLVLWLINADQEVRGTVQEYFRNPWKAATSESPGVIPEKTMGTDVVKAQKSVHENSSLIQMETLRRINEDLVKAFIQSPEYRESRTLYVEMIEDGLLINFLDNPDQPLFLADSHEFTPYGKWVFSTVSWELARYSETRIELEGHTEQGFLAPDKIAASWEVSTARAHSAMRLLLDNGLQEGQIIKVAGYGGSIPLQSRQPEDPLNRRVAIKVRGDQKPK